MLKKNRLFSITGMAVMMACGFACAQEGVSKDAKKSKTEEKSESQKIAKEEQLKPVQHADSQVKTAEQPKEGALQEQEILKISEAFGHFIGRNLNTPGVKFDVESIIKGMREGVAGKPAPMSDQEYEAMMSKLQEQSFAALSETNLKAANDFLEKNSKEANVIEVVPGQLQYTVLKEGNGAVVEEHFSPQINYTGKYLDGTVFGSSEDAGGPITIPLDQTIPGFSKGLLGMKEGEKRKLFVHPGLAYGTTGQLPPNSLLIFEVEVVKANAEKPLKEVNSHAFSENDDLLDEELEDGELSLNEFSEGDEEQDSNESTPEQSNLQALADKFDDSNKLPNEASKERANADLNKDNKDLKEKSKKKSNDDSDDDSDEDSDDDSDSDSTHDSDDQDDQDDQDSNQDKDYDEDYDDEGDEDAADKNGVTPVDASLKTTLQHSVQPAAQVQPAVVPAVVPASQN